MYYENIYFSLKISMFAWIWQTDITESLNIEEEDLSAMSVEDMKALVENKLKHQTALIVFFVQLFIKLIPFAFIYVVYR